MCSPKQLRSFLDNSAANRSSGPSVDGPLLDSAQAAAYLGITERHIRRLRDERRIAFVPVGRLIRFKREDLDAYIAKRRVEATR